MAYFYYGSTRTVPKLSRFGNASTLGPKANDHALLDVRLIASSQHYAKYCNVFRSLHTSFIYVQLHCVLPTAFCDWLFDVDVEIVTRLRVRDLTDRCKEVSNKTYNFRGSSSLVWSVFTREYFDQCTWLVWDFFSRSFHHGEDWGMINARHHANRSKWAAEHQYWMQSDWSQMLFTGEYGFSLVIDCNIRNHTTRLAENFLEAKKIQRMECPACYPDLNIIQDAWDLFGRDIQRNHSLRLLSVTGCSLEFT
ncbi:hypothetical protein TNCV_3209431 [Trichonephila clavipes]|nr:hypothetical protein TNCV_3209431 [Trichonephila clavipes]